MIHRRAMRSQLFMAAEMIIYTLGWFFCLFSEQLDLGDQLDQGRIKQKAVGGKSQFEGV